MANEITIKNVQSLLKEYIGPDNKVTEVKQCPLTAPGENYSSVLFKLDVKLKNEKHDKERWLSTAAKLIPQNEKARIMCDIQVSVKKEIAMFNVICPILQELQREHGIKEVVDYIPKLYGWRFNLHGNNDVIDDDAVIVMENLKESGFVNVDRFIGLDLQTAKLILKDLAAFHALPIALKSKKPDVFENKIKPYLTVHKPPHRPKKENPQGDTIESFMLDILQEDSSCKPYMSEIRELLSKDIFIHRPPREPFASISHGDMWINNAMVKFEDGKPVKSKLIDFQFYDYKSPARDLFFFLFTSVQRKVLEDNFDDLVQFYYDRFLAHLETLKCDTRLFGFNDFLEELALSAVLEFKHAMVFITLTVMRQGGPSPGFYPGRPMNLRKIRDGITQEAKEKCWFMTQLCRKKGWM